LIPENDELFEQLNIEGILDEDAKDRKKRRNSKPPKVLPVFPLTRRPFFPGMAAPIAIEPGPYFDLIKQVAKTEQKLVCLLLAKSEHADVNKIKGDDLYPVGTLARILKILPMEQGGAQVIFNMEKRMVVTDITDEVRPILVKGSYHEDKQEVDEELKAYSICIMSTIKELLKLNPLFKEELQIFLSHSEFTEPGKLADFAVALTTATREEWQTVLATFDIKARMAKALELLKKELDLAELQQSINQKIDQAINKTQKEFFLREQLKTIKRELGIERDDKLIDKEKFEARLKDKNVPPDVMKVIQEELDKFGALEPHSSEYGVIRGYLDWLTQVPWGISSPDDHKLKVAEEILAEDHFGLEDVKQRILEIIGVGKLSKGIKGSIICLLGPPGVGKTSIGKSIARALSRKFYRFSVGGMRDEAEIKGHRRTYIGAMPGKLIQALKSCQTMNPVIMLDEIDKMGTSYHGDPASALLEVLDPEQNCEFLDHYLDVRTDLSGVLFIVTANVLESIPEPLKDRMEILRLSGYIASEKLEIAKKYLIPKNQQEMGLKKSHLSFTDTGIKAIINGYAREAGVRSLEGYIKKIMRKVALEIAKKSEEEQTPKKRPQPVKITDKNLDDYLGKPKFTSDRFYDKTPVGVAMGLAWTALGGATLYIEALKVPSEKTEMKLTGQAGHVMKESSEIAWSFLHGSLRKYAPGFTFFDKSQVHLHIPEGATPKDGPSAGITMVTAMLSLLFDVPVLNDLGMTGEITLTGKVLPIGGVKEKIVAARRSGLKTLIFPKDNLRDLDELPEHIKKGLTLHFVDHYDDVFKIAFPKEL